MKLQQTIFIIFAMLLLASCEKEDPTKGPQIGEYFGDFEFIEPFTFDSSAINFNDSPLSFNAKFSINTWWKISITGLRSGATKTLGGKTNELGALGVWTGTANDVFFLEEACLVELTFRDYPDTFRDTIIIDQTLDYNHIGTVINTLNTGVGVSAFGPLDYKTLVPAEGKTAVFMKGYETGNLWWLNGFGMPQLLPYQLPGTNPDQVYFNAFVYGTGSGATRVVIGFKEDDDLNKEHSIADDSWEKSLVIDWEGWKLISFPMSETIETTDNGYGNGNHTKELDKIVSVEFGLFSNNGQADPNEKAVGVDHPVFTIGPLKNF